MVGQQGPRLDGDGACPPEARQPADEIGAVLVGPEVRAAVEAAHQDVVKHAGRIAPGPPSHGGMATGSPRDTSMTFR